MNARTLDRTAGTDLKPLTPIETLRTQLEQRATEFQMVLPSHIDAAKFQRTVLTAVQASPQLLECERRSFLTACMKSAQDGLLPDGREAAIVPFNTRMKIDGLWKYVKLAQYMPMVYGLRKKILQSGEVTDIFAAVVYRQELEGDHPRFVYEEGTERQLRHKPILDPDFVPKDEDIVLAYSVATFDNGFKSFEVMRRHEINDIRESSQTGAVMDAKGEPRDPKGPWVDWFAEMAKKSVIRRHSKSLPQSGDIIADVEAEDMAFARRSAVALLDSRVPDEPLLEGGTFDDETGEELTPEVETPSEQPKKESEPEPEPEPEAEEPLTQHAALHLEPGAEDEPEDLGTDEMGVTRTEDEAVAEAFIARAREAETIIDLRKLEREAEMELAAMPTEISECVDSEFAAARKRLTGKK